MGRKKNVLATIMQGFAITCLVSVLWMIVGYSLAFTDGGAVNAYIGGFSRFFLAGMSLDSVIGTIPESVFMTFQMTFAIITPALICGSFADRMKFSALMWFMRSEEHTSELQSLMRISYADFCLKKKNTNKQ